jgi:replicative DNA helicase Mcm
MVSEGEAIHVLEKFFRTRWLEHIYDLSLKYPDTVVLDVDYWALRNFDPVLQHLIENEPTKLLSSASTAIQKIDLPIDKELKDVVLRIIGYPTKTPIRDIRHKDILKYICVEGIVRRVSSVKPKYTEIAFACLRCGHVTKMPQPRKNIVEPYECESSSCGRKGPFNVVHSESTYTDYQVLEIQESPDSLRGTQPRNLLVNAYDELTDQVTAGDKVLISGILNTYQSVSKEGKSTVLDIVLEANNIERLDKSYDELDISENDMEAIWELSKDPDIKTKIAQSIAPSIYGLDDAKEALALQLFSGVAKNLPDGARIRGDIHTMLIGDPGTAKSQLVKRIVDLSPRGIFNSGKSTSGVGLTAAVVKDNLNDDRWTLEGGALVMADNGMCAVDEMDKMREEDVSALHEAMEQQTITVSKAGIHASLNTRCALVAAANPVDGRFDKYDTDIARQINMKPTLLSRFDLIFVIQDIPDKENDARIAAHISRNHINGGKLISGQGIECDITPPVDPDLLRKYVAFARANIRPVITEEARKIIEEFYVNVRSAFPRQEGVPLTARKIDGMYRLAEASAKARLSDHVSADDAKSAIRLVVACLKQIGMEDNGYNIDVIECNGTKSQREKIKQVKEYIMDHANCSREDIQRDLGFSEEYTSSLVKKLKHSGDLIEVGHNILRCTC